MTLGILITLALLALGSAGVLYAGVSFLRTQSRIRVKYPVESDSSGAVEPVVDGRPVWRVVVEGVFVLATCFLPGGSSS